MTILKRKALNKSSSEEEKSGNHDSGRENLKKGNPEQERFEKGQF